MSWWAQVRTALLVIPLSVIPSPHYPSQSGSWLPEQRVLISDFSYIDAVAASPWLLFVATRHGLLIYDRAARTWRPPVTALDGYPAGRVRTALTDQGGNAVWLGVGLGGGYVRYDADARLWSPGTPPPDVLAGALTVDRALARAPAADALRALILTDPRLRTYQFTSAAGTPDRPELFFGTSGMGVVRIDPQTAEWEPLSFGLVAPGVGAIAPTGDGVWAAANARPGERRGLTFVAADLRTTRPAEGGGAALGFSFAAARRMLSADGALWLVTEQGVLRIDPGSMRSRVFDIPNATSLAPAPDGVWVGSAHGLAVITRAGQIVRVSTDFPALSLVAVRETLWVGTPAGLVMLPPGKADAARVAALTQPIWALARARDTIVAATDRSLAWRDPTTRSWTDVPVPFSLGRPTALAADPDGGMWVGGTLGLAFAAVGRAEVRVLTVPLDLPAAVRDVAAAGRWLWVATDSGLVRFDRRAAANR
jgi:hypothetical protein